MKKSLLLVVGLVALTGCAGVTAFTDTLEKPKWDGGVVDVAAFTKDDWLSFTILPTLWGGVGFSLNGGSVEANLFPLNVMADFTQDAVKAPATK